VFTAVQQVNSERAGGAPAGRGNGLGHLSIVIAGLRGSLEMGEEVGVYEQYPRQRARRFYGA